MSIADSACIGVRVRVRVGVGVRVRVGAKDRARARARAGARVCLSRGPACRHRIGSTEVVARLR